MEALLKIAELAERSGVSIATLKHYLREGLIAPAKKTGRTMAYYDAALADRVRSIKDLQRERYLSLDLIKQTTAASTIAHDDLTAAEAIASVLAKNGGTRTRTRDELIARGVSARQLDWLAAARLAAPDATGAYRGDDLALLAVLGEARTSGISPRMLPFEILGEYLAALRALVEIELRMFRTGVVGNAAPAEIPTLTEAATRLSERLVVLLRRKLLLPTLHTILEETTHVATRPAPTPAPRRVRREHRPRRAR